MIHKNHIFKEGDYFYNFYVSEFEHIPVIRKFEVVKVHTPHQVECVCVEWPGDYGTRHITRFPDWSTNMYPRGREDSFLDRESLEEHLKATQSPIKVENET